MRVAAPEPSVALRLFEHDDQLCRVVASKPADTAMFRPSANSTSNGSCCSVCLGDFSINSRVSGCSGVGLSHIAATAENPEEVHETLQPLLRLIAALSEEIKTFDRRIEKLAAEKYMHTQLLGRVNGVGYVTAPACVLTLETPLRFARSRDVEPYWGWCPNRKTPETSSRNCASARPETECCVSCWWEARNIFWGRLVQTPIVSIRAKPLFHRSDCMLKWRHGRDESGC